MKLPGDAYVLFVDESGPKDLGSPWGTDFYIGGLLIAADQANPLMDGFRQLKIETYKTQVVFHSHSFFQGYPLGANGGPVWPGTEAQAFLAGVVEWLRTAPLVILGVHVRKSEWINAHPDILAELSRVAGTPLDDADALTSVLRSNSFAAATTRRLAKLVRHYAYPAGLQGAAQLACKTLDRWEIDAARECILVADKFDSLDDSDEQSMEAAAGRWLRTVKETHQQTFQRIRRPPTFIPDSELDLLQVADLIAYLVGDEFSKMQHSEYLDLLGPKLSPVRARGCRRSGMMSLPGAAAK